MKYVPASVTRAAGRALLQTRKTSPTLMFGAGIVGIVGSTVLACKATLKVEEILIDHEDKLAQATFVRSKNRSDYTHRDFQQDKVVLYVQTTQKLARLYAPALVVGAASVAALTCSHRTLTKRNIALTAAYAALEKGFSEYRERVIAEVGEEKERSFRYPLEACELDDEETGKKKVVQRLKTGSPSMYARFFGPGSPSWQATPEYNLFFVKCQQNYVNDLLRSRGHVFLNEVYDLFGIDRDKAGAVVGWIYGNGDDFIDFGVFKPFSSEIRDHIYGTDGSILLDFNVDGIIYDKI